MIEISIKVSDGNFEAHTFARCDCCGQGVRWSTTRGMRYVATPTFVEYTLRDRGWSMSKYHTCPTCKAPRKPKKRRRGRS